MANKIDEVLKAKLSEIEQEEKPFNTKKMTDLPFFAIGASHVIRKDSNVVQLLQDKGWLGELPSPKGEGFQN